MNHHEHDYAELLGLLGGGGASGDGIPESEIDAAENVVGMRMPASLRTFFRLAGRTAHLAQAYVRLLQPHAWRIEPGTAVFMEEDHAVTLYGISTDLNTPDDPPTLATLNTDDLDWFEVCSRVSDFIKVMLCWAATSGEILRFRREMRAPPDIANRLDPQWAFVGRIGVSDMRAYIQQGRVLCHLDDLAGSRLVVAARLSGEVDSIVEELRHGAADATNVRQGPVHVDILPLVGDLEANGAAAELLRGRFNTPSVEGSGLVLDLAGLQQLGERGVGALVMLRQRARRANGEVKLANLQKQPTQIIRLLRLDRVFDCCDSVETALSRFGDVS